MQLLSDSLKPSPEAERASSRSEQRSEQRPAGPSHRSLQLIPFSFSLAYPCASFHPLQAKGTLGFLPPPKLGGNRLWFSDFCSDFDPH